MRRTTLSLLALASVLVAAPATAADEDNSRGVNIIDAAPTPAPAATPMPAPSVAPGPAEAKKNAPSTAPSSYDMMSIKSRPVDLGAPQVPANPDPAPRPRDVSLGAIPLDPKVGNTAALSLDLLPALDVPIGAKVSFRVTTKKPGYLILVDVDATGKLTQIYPAGGSLTDPHAKRDANYIRPGKPTLIPSPGDAYANIEYVATPPAGVAMIVAILSDQPVQIIDLPDLPARLTGHAEALTYLANLAKELRIPRPGTSTLQEAHWSFDAKFYAIR